MQMSREPHYMIPARYRKMENMHIIFWLFKDVSWCMGWKVLGLAMILPTLAIAVLIAWRTRSIKSELAHNMAVAFWIGANSLWMIAEFFEFDTMHIWQQFEGKHLALIPFAMGVLILANYYLLQRPKEDSTTQVVTL